METILCACGCGSRITPFDKKNRPRRYISGHNRNSITTPDPNKKITKICNWCGKQFLVYKCKKGTKFCSRHCRAVNWGVTYGHLGGFASAKSPKKHNPPIHKGKNHHKWKGGITPQNKLRRTNGKYIEWRKKVFQRDSYTCRECEHKCSRLQAHHIKGVSTNSELIYDISNGVTLCIKCHSKYHPNLISLISSSYFYEKVSN